MCEGRGTGCWGREDTPGTIHRRGTGSLGTKLGWGADQCSLSSSSDQLLPTLHTTERIQNLPEYSLMKRGLFHRPPEIIPTLRPFGREHVQLLNQRGASSSSPTPQSSSEIKLELKTKSQKLEENRNLSSSSVTKNIDTIEKKERSKEATRSCLNSENQEEDKEGRRRKEDRLSSSRIFKKETHLHWIGEQVRPGAPPPETDPVRCRLMSSSTSFASSHSSFTGTLGGFSGGGGPQTLPGVLEKTSLFILSSSTDAECETHISVPPRGEKTTGRTDTCLLTNVRGTNGRIRANTNRLKSQGTLETCGQSTGGEDGQTLA